MTIWIIITVIMIVIILIVKNVTKTSAPNNTNSFTASKNIQDNNPKVSNDTFSALDDVGTTIPQYDEDGNKEPPSCHYCDFSDLAAVRKQGLDDSTYTFCSKCNDTIKLKYQCPYQCHDMMDEIVAAMVHEIRNK